ncbi:unnamed protein product [Adineta ricciae]|uniref:Uncharacterized protein n=1 Tax=Adineta ricciae TaxID=249248 RepID=A0A815V089_ADIRI|nr:unnamed protein product [Adineta ricciae]CAF1522988.1 unnamed protein product [Adineta ricciae]
MTSTVHVNTKSLPPNVFDLQHEDFYDFVEMHVRVLQAKILQFQLISDAATFIECQDPTEILQYNSERLGDLKQKACLTTTSGTCIILPGILASFKILKKCLLKKIEENKKNRNNPINSSTPTPTPGASRAKSTDEHRNYISTTINQWLRAHHDELNLKKNVSLEANVDYQVEFTSTNSGNDSVAIICGCGAKATLSRANNTGYFQISNYYRHIERGSCSMILKKTNEKPHQDTSDEENDDITRSNSSDVTPKSPSIDVNRSKTSSKRRLSTSGPATGRRSKRRRS